jgi:hypothetical protein
MQATVNRFPLTHKLVNEFGLVAAHLTMLDQGPDGVAISRRLAE